MVKRSIGSRIRRSYSISSVIAMPLLPTSGMEGFRFRDSFVHRLDQRPPNPAALHQCVDRHDLAGSLVDPIRRKAHDLFALHGEEAVELAVVIADRPSLDRHGVLRRTARRTVTLSAGVRPHFIRATR